MDYTVTTADDNLKDGNIVVRNNIFKRFTPHFEAGKAYAITVHLGMNGYEGDDDSDEDGTIPVDPDPLPDSPDLTPASLHTEVGFTTEVTPWDAEYNLDLSTGHIPSDLDMYPWFIGTTTDGTDFGYRLNGSKTAQSNVPVIVKYDYSSSAKMFQECSGLTNLDVSNFDTSNVTSMYSMFQSCSGLTSLDLSNFNTSKVTDMGGMFSGCTNLTSLDLRNFDTSKVTNMNKMFGCPNGLNITCKTAFKDWCIANAETLQLPTPLRDPDSTQWHIVD